MHRTIFISAAAISCLIVAFVIVNVMPEQSLQALDRADTKALLIVFIAIGLAILSVLIAHFFYLPTLRRFVTNIARIFAVTLPMTSCVPYAITTMTMELSTKPNVNLTFDPSSIPHVQIWIVGATVICLSMLIRFFADYFEIVDI